MLFGDLLIILFYLCLFLVIIFSSVKFKEYRNKSKNNWAELDDKIEEMRKTIAEDID